LFDPLNILLSWLETSAWGELEVPAGRAGRSVDGQRMTQIVRLFHYAIVGSAITEGQCYQNQAS
jgi:hypothetical protein